MAVKEGNLEAPTRHPIDWKNPDFYNESSLMDELERVYEICHAAGDVSVSAMPFRPYST